MEEEAITICKRKQLNKRLFAMHIMILFAAIRCINNERVFVGVECIVKFRIEAQILIQNSLIMGCQKILSSYILNDTNTKYPPADPLPPH